MATNREMLKEAIAEAKAVKEMAIANAKAALEETFTPQLKSILSAKLQEMEMEDEELDEAGFGPMTNVKGHGNIEDDSSLYEEEMEEGEGENMYEVDLEELLAELENEEENLNEAEEGEEEGEEETEEDDKEIEDLSDDELKEMIEDVIAQMIKDGELEAGSEFEKDEEGEEMEMSDEDEEEVDLAELLKEIEEMEDLEEVEGGLPSEPEIKAAAEKLKAAVSSGELSKEDLTGLEAAADAVDVGAINEAEGEDLKAEAQAEIDKLKKDLRIKNIAQKIGIGVASLSLALFAYGISQDADPAAAARAFDMLDLNPNVVGGVIGMIGGTLGSIGLAAKKFNIGKQIKSKEYQRDKMEEELAEALTTIKTLKAELNEINLLNAKLLYSNKIFKSKNLNESQKVKVLSSFDKAKNVGEVKMVFETLNEGIKVKKGTIKENLGRASKSTITPTKKQPIVESNDAFLRMQKLAGLI
jgi:hypothetical protein